MQFVQFVIQMYSNLLWIVIVNNERDHTNEHPSTILDKNSPFIIYSYILLPEEKQFVY